MSVPRLPWAVPALIWIAAQLPLHRSAAQKPAGRIVGRVIEAHTGRPLSSTAVQLVGTTRGVSTAEDGRFTPLSRSPYELAPGLMWFQFQESNRRAGMALLHERGGKPLGYVRHECASSERQGANTIWSACEVVRLMPGHAARRERLFGSIIERDGHYKFIALSNGL